MNRTGSKKHLKISEEVVLSGLVFKVIQRHNPGEKPRMTPEIVQAKIREDYRKNYPLSDIRESMESQAHFGVLEREVYCDHVCYGPCSQ